MYESGKLLLKNDVSDLSPDQTWGQWGVSLAYKSSGWLWRSLVTGVDENTEFVVKELVEVLHFIKFIFQWLINFNLIFPLKAFLQYIKKFWSKVILFDTSLWKFLAVTQIILYLQKTSLIQNNLEVVWLCLR